MRTILSRRIASTESTCCKLRLIEPTDRDAPPTVAEQLVTKRVAGIYSILNQWSPTSVPSVAGIPADAADQFGRSIRTCKFLLCGLPARRSNDNCRATSRCSLGFYNIRIVHVIRARDVNAPFPATITELTPNGLRPDPTQGEIYRYEASGQFNQRQFFLGFNSRFSRMFQLNGNYSLSKTTNDTDGQGGQLFPMNSYDTSGEFGRSSFDIRHRFTIFGTINLPWWKVVLSPFVIANSGPGFNITTGQDRNLDRQFNERPSFAGPNADCSSLTIRCTRFGNFNLAPLPGETIIPRNFGQAPGLFVVNLRVSRTFAFGNQRGNAAAQARPAGQTPAGRDVQQVDQVVLWSPVVPVLEWVLVDQDHRVVARLLRVRRGSISTSRSTFRTF